MGNEFERFVEAYPVIKGGIWQAYKLATNPDAQPDARLAAGRKLIAEIGSPSSPLSLSVLTQFALRREIAADASYPMEIRVEAGMENALAVIDKLGHMVSPIPDFEMLSLVLDMNVPSTVREAMGAQYVNFILQRYGAPQATELLTAIATTGNLNAPESVQASARRALETLADPVDHDERLAFSSIAPRELKTHAASVTIHRLAQENTQENRSKLNRLSDPWTYALEVVRLADMYLVRMCAVEDTPVNRGILRTIANKPRTYLPLKQSARNALDAFDLRAGHDASSRKLGTSARDAQQPRPAKARSG